jgi:hypothetical protein
LTPPCNTNCCNKEGSPTLKAIANMHVHLLSESLYGALPENFITDL